MNITLLNITNSTAVAKTGKPYQIAEVAYKNNTFQGKVETFKVTSYMKAYSDIAASQAGDTLEVTVEKQNGFNQWVSAHKVVPGVPQTSAPPAQVSVQSNTAKPANTYGKDFETKEERAKKQVYIVRQSAISNAIAALSLGAKSALKAEDILVLAKKFENFVFDMGGATGFDDLPNFDPSFGSTEPQID